MAVIQSQNDHSETTIYVCFSHGITYYNTFGYFWVIWMECHVLRGFYFSFRTLVHPKNTKSCMNYTSSTKKRDTGAAMCSVLKAKHIYFPECIEKLQLWKDPSFSVPVIGLSFQQTQILKLAKQGGMIKNEPWNQKIDIHPDQLIYPTMIRSFYLDNINPEKQTMIIQHLSKVAKKHY